MDSVNFEIKKMAQNYGSLDNIERLRSPEFYKQLTGKQFDECKKSDKLELPRVIFRLHKYILRSLEAVAIGTPGKALHQLKEKKSLVRILDSIIRDMDRIVIKSKPSIFTFRDRRGENTKYAKLKNETNKLQEMLRKEINYLSYSSSELFDIELQSDKNYTFDAHIRKANDLYLAKKMGIEEHIEELIFQKKSDQEAFKDKTNIIHEIVTTHLKNQTDNQLKSIGNPDEFRKHISDVAKIIEKRLREKIADNLFSDLSNALKAEKINKLLPSYLSVNDKLQVDQVLLGHKLKELFLEPFADKENAEKKIFVQKQPEGWLLTIKKVISSIKTFFFNNSIIAQQSREIKVEIEDAIKKYYGTSNQKIREELYETSQIVADDLIRTLQKKFEERTDLQDKKDLLAPLFADRALRKNVDDALLNQMFFRSRYNEKLRFKKIGKELQFILSRNIHELNANQKIDPSKGILEFHKIKILLDSYYFVSGYLKNEQFLRMLKSIKIDESNKEMLTLLWKHILRRAYPVKEMGQRKMLAQYRNYLMIKDHIPKTLKTELDLFALHIVEKNRQSNEMRLLIDNYNNALTLEEKENIEILANAFDGAVLSEAEELKIEAFIKSAAGNIRYNKIAGKMLKEKSGFLYEIVSLIRAVFHDISNSGVIAQRVDAFLENFLTRLKAPSIGEKEQLAVQFLHYFSWKTRNLERAEQIYEKLQKNWKLLQRGKNIPEDQKLTLQEISRLRDVINLRIYINRPRNQSIKSIISKDKVFNNKVFRLARKTNRILYKIEQIYERQASKIYKSGDIFADDRYRGNVLFDYKERLEDKLSRLFISNYRHNAVIINSGNGSNKMQCGENLILSELNDAHQKTPFSSHAFLISDVWRIDPSRLLEGMNLHYIIEMYRSQGKLDWRKEIQNEFAQIAEIIHSKDFSKLVNDPLKRIWAGIADFIPFGHRGKKINDWNEKINKKLFPEKINKGIICSSFATQTTILTLTELNKRLAQKLAEHFKAKKNQELCTYFSNAKEVFTLPYPSDLKLSTVHPGLALHFLKKSKCIQKIERAEQPEIMKRLFIF